MIVSLQIAKAHLRVDGDAEDDDIELKLAAAEEAVIGQLNRPVPWQDAEGQDVPIPAAIKLAILLVCGDLYANRDSVITGTIRTDNSTVERLLNRYRKVVI